MGYFVSGRMKVVMDDGEEMDYSPRDFAVMAELLGWDYTIHSWTS
jgi:uncharacterized cupin superfamily protein